MHASWRVRNGASMSYDQQRKQTIARLEVARDILKEAIPGCPTDEDPGEREPWYGITYARRSAASALASVEDALARFAGKDIAAFRENSQQHAHVVARRGGR